MNVERILISEIHDDENFNCRGKITPIDVIDLANDIKVNGLHQPVVVALYDDAKQMETGKKYRLAAGFRRLMAHRVNEEKYIFAVIKPILSEVDALKINLAENIQRQNLNIYQEALAIKRMKDLGLNEMDTASVLGMSRGWVQVRFMLLSLPKEVHLEAAAGFFTQQNIRDLYTIYNRTGDVTQIFSAIKELKEGKARTGDIKINRTKQEVMREKRQRKRSEIFNMMAHIQDSGIGNGLHTRTMSWCAGEISTGDLVLSLEAFAKENNLEYIPFTLDGQTE
jgi:ParB/RepB/Spo0J family partition protein